MPSVIRRVLTASEKAGADVYSPTMTRDGECSAELASEPFWTPYHLCAWVIVVDVDHGDADLRLASLPVQPSWIVSTSRGRAQAGWIIDAVALGPDARPGPQTFLDAVTSALTNAVGGDPAFTHGRCRNPWYRGASVMWGHTSPRTLGELKGALVGAGLWHPTNLVNQPSDQQPRGRDWPAEIPAGERNVTVFSLARRDSDPEAAAYALAARCVPSLPPAEVALLARQAVRYATGRRRVPDELRHGPEWEALVAEQRELGRRGGQRRTAAQREALAQGPDAASVVRSAVATLRHAQVMEQAEPLLAQGRSVAAVAAEIGVSRGMLRRAIATSGGLAATGASQVTHPSADPLPPQLPRPSSAPSPSQTSPAAVPSPRTPVSSRPSATAPCPACSGIDRIRSSRAREQGDVTPTATRRSENGAPGEGPSAAAPLPEGRLSGGADEEAHGDGLRVREGFDPGSGRDGPGGGSPGRRGGP